MNGSTGLERVHGSITALNLELFLIVGKTYVIPRSLLRSRLSSGQIADSSNTYSDPELRRGVCNLLPPPMLSTLHSDQFSLSRLLEREHPDKKGREAT